ncbi:MAG: Fe(2+)-trafficking protein, partial [Pseudomonadales bacterium]|nr:Fe(2+)-trafficking protein [Pseudomonadales bacterium]
INEHHLSMVDAQARQFLADQMHKFLANEDYERPAGYVPPS